MSLEQISAGPSGVRGKDANGQRSADETAPASRSLARFPFPAPGTAAGGASTRIALNRCVIGDCRETLRSIPDATFHCCVTSPPYWGLRDYGHKDQIGLEKTPDEYVAQLVGVFREVRRVLRDDGTLWLNLGDSYASTAGGGQGKNGALVDRSASRLGIREGHATKVVAGLKPKDLVGIPWAVAFALRADGWYLRSDIIWSKINPMPESVTDRPTKAHEYVFLLSKSERYHYDADAIRETNQGIERPNFDGRKGTLPKSEVPGRTNANDRAGNHPLGRNARTVWSLASEPYTGAHFATMPTALVTRCILAGSPLGGAVLDPFLGSGTVGQVAESLGRTWFGCDLSYEDLIAERTAQTGLAFRGPQ